MISLDNSGDTILNFHGAEYKPSPSGGKVFSKYFPWLDIGDIMPSKLYSEDKPLKGLRGEAMIPQALSPLP